MIHIALFGGENIYVKEMIQHLSLLCKISLVSKKVTAKSFSGEYDLISLPKITPIKLPLFPFIAWSKIRKLNKNVDIYGVHYLDIVWAIIVSLQLLKRPVVYFVYGGDINKKFGRVYTYILKKALLQFDLIFVEVSSNEKLLVEKYGVNPDKINSNILWWNVNPCFIRDPSDHNISELRKKWMIAKKYVIFSPRMCYPVYQHDVLINAIGKLNLDMRNKIEVVVTKGADNEVMADYIDFLKKLASDVNVCLHVIPKRLSPEEMKEIYNLSHINVNIPVHDFFGRSIMEGAVCGSIPLLNEEIVSYHDLMVDGKNCIMTKPTSDDVAHSIEEILHNYDDYHDKMYRENYALFSKYQDVEKTSNDLIEIMKKICDN